MLAVIVQDYRLLRRELWLTKSKRVPVSLKSPDIYLNIYGYIAPFHKELRMLRVKKNINKKRNHKQRKQISNQNNNKSDQYKIGMVPLEKDSILWLRHVIAYCKSCCLLLSNYTVQTYAEGPLWTDSHFCCHIHNNLHSSNLCSRKID